MISCDSKKLFGKPTLTAQQMTAWAAKNCSPRRAAREFHTGGPEAGTLVGARRAPGLFDENWGNSYPLTRKEQQRVAAGDPVADPFFQPPTYAYEGNWIADKLENLRKKMAGTPYTTALQLNKLCGPAGSMTSCSSPSGTVSWVSDTAIMTKADNARFAAAYCVPGCQTGGRATPPAGFTERVVKTEPRNQSVKARFSCGPKPPEAEKIGPGLPPLALPPADTAPSGVPLACVSDIILGREDGQFQSGWFRVIRRGVATLTPAPIICEDL